MDLATLMAGVASLTMFIVAGMCRVSLSLAAPEHVVLRRSASGRPTDTARTIRWAGATTLLGRPRICSSCWDGEIQLQGLRWIGICQSRR
jgi:hypothetical protein